MSELHLGDDAVLTVKAMNCQYRIEADPEQWEDWPTPVNSLTTGEDGWISVLTGTRFGPVTIRFQFLATAPESVDAGWEVVGERTCAPTTTPFASGICSRTLRRTSSPLCRGSIGFGFT
jgi:hypothetical protein